MTENRKMDYAKTQEALMQRYGAIKGLQMNATVMPNLVRDFTGMLEKAPRGQEISEDYLFDDIKGGIRLIGRDGEITGFKLL